VDSETLEAMNLSRHHPREHNDERLNVNGLEIGQKLRVGETHLEVSAVCTPATNGENPAGLRREMWGRRGMLCRVIEGGMIGAAIRSKSFPENQGLGGLRRSEGLREAGSCFFHFLDRLSADDPFETVLFGHSAHDKRRVVRDQGQEGAHEMTESSGAPSAPGHRGDFRAP